MRSIILAGLIRFSNSGFPSLLKKNLNQLVFFGCTDNVVRPKFDATVKHLFHITTP
ncbi:MULTISPECIES: hypothetical protein [unclassified Nostoc]|uniref:hypothetical protein n=1 Tax=unclassified Nostoc TaxID=2593658 RepID=UPI0026288575|nr:hypothetical protein [Nostoc sp. S13]